MSVQHGLEGVGGEALGEKAGVLSLVFIPKYYLQLLNLSSLNCVFWWPKRNYFRGRQQQNLFLR